VVWVQDAEAGETLGIPAAVMAAPLSLKQSAADALLERLRQPWAMISAVSADTTADDSKPRAIIQHAEQDRGFATRRVREHLPDH